MTRLFRFDSFLILFRQNCRFDMNKPRFDMTADSPFEMMGIAYLLFISKQLSFFCHLQTDNFIVLIIHIFVRKCEEQNDNFLQ